MAALKPVIIRDTIELINLYKKNPAFRKRFDAAVKINVNATYKYRSVKLYLEVLASVNFPKYREPYQKVRMLIVHDDEGLVGKTLMTVNPKDLSILGLAANKAEKGINTTQYSDKEIEKINQIENSVKAHTQKKAAYQERLNKTEYLTPAQTTTEPEKQPTTAQQPLRQLPSTPEKTSSPLRSTPDLSGNRSWSTRFRSLFNRGVTKEVGVTTVTEGVVAKAGTRFAAGRVVTAGVGKLAAKLGVKTIAKAAIGIAAKLGVSLVTGIATAGVGLAVGVIIIIITTFPGLIKKLFKTIFWIVVGVIAFVVFVFISQRGIKMNSLLPPYSVGFAEPLPSSSPSPTPSGSPTPSITPPGGAVALCPIPGGIIACGPSKPVFTNYSNCNQGHCAGDYGYPSWCSYPGTSYAIDIPGAIGQSVLIPSITDPATKQVHPLDCIYVGPYVAEQIITQFSCKDTVTGSSVWIQFHHLQNNYSVAVGTKKVSGDSGGNIARDPDGYNHVHVQIGLNGGCGSDSSGCVAADQYLQCGR